MNTGTKSISEFEAKLDALDTEQRNDYYGIIGSIAILKTAAFRILNPDLARAAVPQAQRTSSSLAVRVGQIWADCYPGSTRRVAIERIEGNYAFCRSSVNGQIYRNRLDRFKLNTRGYRLVEDVPV